MRWNLRTGGVEVVPANFYGITAVNHRGTAASQETSDLPLTAALFTDRLIELPPLVSGLEAWPLALTTSGVAAGMAEARDDRLVAVRWTCEKGD